MFTGKNVTTLFFYVFNISENSEKSETLHSLKVTYFSPQNKYNLEAENVHEQTEISQQILYRLP